MKATIRVYLKSSQVFEYTIDAPTKEELGSKAREHEYAIMTSGFRHSGVGEHTWYGVHWVDKVKVIGTDLDTSYADIASGT